jgi:hypothetical protein
LHHDAYHYGINRAAEEFVREHSPAVVDCGIVSRTATLDADPWIAYAGLRLIRVNPTSGVDHIRAAYTETGRAVPDLDPSVAEHDAWGCANVSPCERCRGGRAIRVEAAATVSPAVGDDSAPSAPGRLFGAPPTSSTHSDVEEIWAE